MEGHAIRQPRSMLAEAVLPFLLPSVGDCPLTGEDPGSASLLDNLLCDVSGC